MADPIVLTELSALCRFGVADEAIAKMAEEYLPLTIAHVNDAAGYKAVHEARMIVRSKRVDVEKVRKELKADALEFGRKVDAEAKRITAMLQPIESHLVAQETAYQAEKDRIKNEARLKAEAEAVRLKAEQERIRAEQEAEARRLQAERAKLAAERAAIEAERKAAQDKIDAERRAIEAERARIETEARIAREAAEAKARAEREEAARARAESLRPDREKLLDVAAAIRSIVVPPVSTEAMAIAMKIRETIDNAASAAERFASMVGSENW